MATSRSDPVVTKTGGEANGSKKTKAASKQPMAGGTTRKQAHTAAAAAAASASTASSTPTRSFGLVHIVLATLSVVGGMASPPLLELYQAGQLLGQSRNGVSQRTRLSAPSIQSTERKLQGKSVEFTCDAVALSNYLHELAVPGLHVVCLHQEEDHPSLTFYKDAQHTSEPKRASGPNIAEWASLRDLLVKHLDLNPADDLHQPWSIYSPVGERLLTETDPGDTPIDGLKQLGMVLVFQGGQWIWPGVEKGYQRTIQIGDNRNATLETLSLHPLVLSVQGFLSEDECDEIQTMATPAMRYSEVTLMDKDKGRPASDFRTSQTTFLNSVGKPNLKLIERRTSSLVRLPISHQEHVQVLRYGHTEKYDTHHDYFEPSLYQSDPKTLNLIEHGRRNRMITVFWYLSDVESGGETVFPRFDKAPNVAKAHQCEVGLRVKPEKGKVIVFYSQTPDGKVDPYSLHGACPVKEGIKWAANKWVWNAPVYYVRE